jgi:hypothetical protein
MAGKYDTMVKYKYFLHYILPSLLKYLALAIVDIGVHNFGFSSFRLI